MPISYPSDIRAESVNNYFVNARKDLSFLGNHKRNAYEDILSISQENDALKIELARQGLYDILPEALFHPIDRFDSIGANEYKERFAEEVEQQRIEEENARNFFSVYDRFIFDLSCVLTRLKEEDYSDNGVLADIICDKLPKEYRSNRFVARTIEFTPRCQGMRGNTALSTLMLRKVLADEGLKLSMNTKQESFVDAAPLYNCRLQQEDDASELYLGNCYEENILCYDIQYWNDDFCDEKFLRFIEEIKVYEEFVNDFFMGVETSLHFNISTHALPVRLSDEACHNYLNYNTNL
ncbi:MAG: hypothetical protein K2G23_07200 [Muribaculaceae bacterium]|nr:hypothetical protein [Muribaculaceae bacterium]